MSLSSLPLPPSILFCLLHPPKGWPIKMGQGSLFITNDLPPSRQLTLFRVLVQVAHSILPGFVYLVFKSQFLCVALAVLELTLQTRLAPNSKIHIQLPPRSHPPSSAKIKRVCHHHLAKVLFSRGFISPLFFLLLCSFLSFACKYLSCLSTKPRLRVQVICAALIIAKKTR